MLAFLTTFLASCTNNTHISSTASGWPENITAPRPEKVSKEFSLHNDKRSDDYYWLNQRTDPKVMEYLKAENTYLDTMMASTKDLAAIGLFQATRRKMANVTFTT